MSKWREVLGKTKDGDAPAGVPNANVVLRQKTGNLLRGLKSEPHGLDGGIHLVSHASCGGDLDGRLAVRGGDAQLLNQLSYRQGLERGRGVLHGDVIGVHHHSEVALQGLVVHVV